ncbi:MAG: Gfo/Idh/MocA family oxidoreductase [Armatimonadota bacterium]|nr:Gfo/Idh/MocA family oxidoreductase [Armatimonadota bacterium]
MSIPLDIFGRPMDRDERIRVGFIGCGGHAFRNVYPVLRFTPTRLVATCDFDAQRAEAFAKTFGAERHYTSHLEMLEREDLDAVLIVTNYDSYGEPSHVRLAMDCMEAGCHAYTEKPPSSSSEEIRRAMEVSERTGKFTLVGFKKCFFTANEKAHEISRYEEFGGITSISVRYPQGIPAQEQKGSLKENPALISFLDHLCHPASILNYFCGPVRTLFYRRNSCGGGFAMLEFASGAIGSLHFTAGQSGTSLLERLEVVGLGANVVVENGIKLTYYRPGGRGPGGYGGSPSFIGDDAGAPLYWEPEFSLGQLYNKGLFMLGYYGEVAHFVDCVKQDRPPEKCGLRDALEITKLYEAFLQPEGRVIELSWLERPDHHNHRGF